MGTVQTATGPVDTAALGFTLMHEHILVRHPGLAEAYPSVWDRAAEMESAVNALKEARALGVRTIVDVTTFEMGRDVAFLAEASRASGVNIVVATGLWLDPPPYFKACGVDKLADLFVQDLMSGIGGSGVRAGIIKCAVDEKGMLPELERVLRAAARAHRATGAPITTHTHAAGKVGLLQQDVFESEGVDLSRVIIGHSGDTTDITYLTGLLERGSYLGMDRFGLDMFLDTPSRVATIAALCKMGHAERMVLSHDSLGYVDWMDRAAVRRQLPNWHLKHIHQDVLPALLAAGVTQDQIDLMTVHNPRRVFERTAPY